MISIKYCICFFVLQLPTAFAAWKCDCDPTFEDPPNMARLRRAMAVDPLAEWKYHFDCGYIREPAASKSVANANTTLTPCEPDPDFSTPLRSWVQEMEYGVSIIWDRKIRKILFRTLDINSYTRRYNATYLDPLTNKCNKAPDTVVSANPQPTVAVTFNRYASQGFRALAASDLKESRKKSVQSRKVEFELDGGEFATSGSKVAFAFKLGWDGFTEWDVTEHDGRESRERAEAQYIETTHQVFIQKPIPSADIITKWANLAKLNHRIDDAFHDYFDKFGTHYHESAAFGGHMTTWFTASYSSPIPSDPQTWANCVATNLSQTHGYGAATDISCEEEFLFSEAYCDGGRFSGCRFRPTPEGTLQQAQEWRENLKFYPIPLRGQKRWVTQLIQVVIKGAKDGEEVYKDVVARFGGLK